ncbi:unnamed protein product [Auanema sp. JU1783]|nr:unnamed protein product [Auanema sp. JU1783]
MSERKPKTKVASSAPRSSQPKRSTKSTFFTCSTLIGVVLSVVAALLLTHLFVKSPIDAVSFTMPDPPDLIDDVRLAQSEIHLNDQIYGPESIAVHPTTGKIYTGLKTGLICEIEMVKNKAKIVRGLKLTSLDGCDGGYHNMEKCGRPLGMRFNKDDELIVVDAYLGVFAIDWTKEKVHKILSGGAQLEEVDQPPVRYLNDLDFLPDGRIVLTESSTKFDDKDFLWDLFEHRPNGRVLLLNPKNGAISLLADNLYFPNGVQVWRGKVIVAEMGMARIVKISPSSGDVTVLIDNLAGYPDSVRKSADGKLWIPLAAPRTSQDNWLNERARLREIMTKVLSPQALQLVVDQFTPAIAVVHKFDPENGKILDTLMDKSQKIVSISSVVEDLDGNLLFGSDANYYLGRLVKSNF